MGQEKIQTDVHVEGKYLCSCCASWERRGHVVEQGKRFESHRGQVLQNGAWGGPGDLEGQRFSSDCTNWHVGDVLPSSRNIFFSFFTI